MQLIPIGVFPALIFVSVTAITSNSKFSRDRDVTNSSLCKPHQTLDNKMIELVYESDFSVKLVQNGWEPITEELKHNGITGMMNRLDDSSRYVAHKLSDKLKK